MFFVVDRCIGMARKKLWTDESLIQEVPHSRSYSELLRRCGLKGTGGGVHASVKRRVAELDLDVSHFTGSGWNTGSRFTPFGNRLPTEEILIKDSTYVNTVRVKERCWKEGLLPKECQRCGSSDWFGCINHLQLDHINGVRSDNRIENLRILCANCHSLTETYCRNLGPVA